MRRKRGSVTVEFTMVGIPLIFVLISIVSISYGMWIYHTQTDAISRGTRYVVVHGSDCTASGNTCTTTVGKIATAIAAGGVGLSSSQWDVTLVSASGANNVTCNPLSSCLTNTEVWPPSPDNEPGTSVAISATYPFTSALSMFFPGTAPVKFGTFNLPAYSKQIIQF
jgi:Flp pilus assembly protein TadG